ncbi:MAG: hypothetical protein JXR14_07545 [Paracoccaceae bacterium]
MAKGLFVFRSKTLSIAVFCMVSSAWGALATPKQECEAVIRALGFTVSSYDFTKRGLFSMEKHRFGELTCYVNRDGEIDSIYRNDEPVAEDGFFGPEALRLRDDITRKADQQIDRAQEERQEAIDAAEQRYEALQARIMSDLSRDLEDLRARSDPFSTKAQSVQPDENVANGTDTQAPDLAGTSPARDVTPTAPETPAQTAGTAPVAVTPPKQTPGTKPASGRRHWVTADILTRRTCPSARCGSVGSFREGESVKVYEERNGWARVTNYYFTNCLNGFSEYVESGDARCIPRNGIRDGKLAEWVIKRHLFAERPATPTESTENLEDLVKGSDNFERHKEAFVAAARALITDGSCKRQDFLKVGGWIRSLQRGEPFYFTYCGGSTIANRLYLDASTGQILR